MDLKSPLVFKLHFHEKLLKEQFLLSCFFLCLKKKWCQESYPTLLLGNSKSFIIPGSNTGIHV